MRSKACYKYMRQDISAGGCTERDEKRETFTPLVHNNTAAETTNGAAKLVNYEKIRGIKN